jgi:hypothetical protein
MNCVLRLDVDRQHMGAIGPLCSAALIRTKAAFVHHCFLRGSGQKQSLSGGKRMAWWAAPHRSTSGVVRGSALRAVEAEAR